MENIEGLSTHRDINTCPESACEACAESFRNQSPKIEPKTQWLDILWEGKLVQINSKLEIREKENAEND